jgi:Glutaminase/DcaP outer membrane protein
MLGLGALALARPSSAQSPAEIQKAIDAAYGKFSTLQEGKNADSIPALAKVDPHLFGIAVVTVDGKVYTAGDVKTEVSIESISKVFTMAQVIQKQGVEAIENRIGVDATGAQFDSIIAVEGVRTVVETVAPEITAAAAAQEPPKPSFEVYGFAMLDIGQNFTQIHPDWFDTLRLTKLPKFENEFGEDNSTFMGVRQSRMGVRSSTPTELGELKTIFEFELFGTGVDSGQTTFRLRHAWGELGPLGAGQYWSPFSDPDVYPNTLEYWGPTGIPWFRNVQLRYTAVSTDTSNLMLALARPGASGDQGVYADRIELEGIRARFPLPDFAAAYKYTGDWGYVRTAGILRRIKWDDTLDDAFDLSGDATGWGWNVSSNLKAGSSDVLRMQFTVGEGVQNEMNDSPVDIGIENNPSNLVTPIVGKPIPIVAVSVFLDHTWNKKYSSAVGYSWQDNDNTDAQAADAFRTGHYALGNLLYYPAPNVMFGGEFQWGRRENFSDGFSSDGVKVQFSFKYNFSWKLGG